MTEARKNSVQQLSELYNVVIGIALSLAIYNTIDSETKIFPVKIEILANFFVILFLIVPFYHGAVRHLFATYVEGGGSDRIKSGALLADFFLLFIEGCVFVAMAAVVHLTISIAWIVVCLLLLDSVWGFLAWLAFTGAQSQHAERKWAIINVCAAVVIIVILVFAEQAFVNKPIMAQLGLLAIVFIRTIIDYSICWHFYFPAIPEQPPQSTTPQKPSAPRRRSG